MIINNASNIILYIHDHNIIHSLPPCLVLALPASLPPPLTVTPSPSRIIKYG